VRLAALGSVAIAAVAVGILAGGGRAPRPRHPSAPTAAVGHTGLAARLERAQAVIDDPASPGSQLAAAGRLEQVATLELARRGARARGAVLAALTGTARSTMRANLGAADALARLVTAHRRPPRWRIVAPPPPATLLGYFRAAQARTGVPWEYLAAIEFVETRFGRVVGTSDAGAQGPMQFMPATWSRYGRGSIRDPRAAIAAAARYLAATGAPRDMAGALYHYNPSRDYVRAVEDYAGAMRSDHRAFYGYYQWQVVFALRRGPVILPPGYPRVGPVPLRLAY